MGIGSFVLGSLDVWRLIRIAVILFVTVLVETVAGTLLTGLFNFLVGVFAFLAIFYDANLPSIVTVAFIKIILFIAVLPIILIILFLSPEFTWLVFRGYGVNAALRQVFMRHVDKDVFNTDDTIMFIKSTLHLVVYAVIDVFNKNGLPAESLDALKQFVQNINNISINNSNIQASTIGSSRTEVTGSTVETGNQNQSS